MDVPISWLQCMRCGSTTDLLKERRFRCACGGLYDVCHNFSRFEGDYTIRLWKDRFEGNCIIGPPDQDDPVFNSGVWRYHKLIMPLLQGEEIVTLGEGIFPIWRAGRNLRQWIGGGINLYILPEGLGPTGSFKDMGGTVAISVAKKAGVKAIACASTGDTSAMAAAYAAAAGITCAVVLPKGKVTEVQMAQPLAHGAKVILVPGSFDDCMKIVEELVQAERVFPINSINPTRIEGHQASVFLACQYLGWQMPDAFVVPLGNGSNSSSIGKGMRLLRDLGFVDRLGKLIAVESEASNPLARSWEAMVEEGAVTQEEWLKRYEPQEKVGKTTATAALIGKPVSYEKVIREIILSKGACLTAGEYELNEAVLVAGSDGHFVCPQTGQALAGLRQAVKRGLIEAGQTVFLVSTATGLKFPSVPYATGKEKILESSSCRTEEIARLIGV